MTLVEPARRATALAARAARVAPKRRFSPLGVFEALATPHGVDRYLELVHPMLTVREMRAAVTDVRRSTEGSVTLTLKPTRQWRGFEAGQFVSITVDIDGVRRTRCYSPCCSQHRADGRIELTIRAHPDGVVSQYLHEHAAPGLVVGLTPADGTFVLPPERPDGVVLISGGSGITPVLSMLRTLCDEGYTGPVTFLHYTRSVDEVSHLDELRELAAAHPNVRLAIAATRTGDGADLQGHFSPEHLDSAAPGWAGDNVHAFVCGPTALMDAVREHYDARGRADLVHTEAFTLSAPSIDAGDATGSIRFARSDVSTDNSGATLLEQAEAAGLSPEFGCRMGICFTCTKVKTSGCTRDIRSGELNADPDTEVQLCVSVPVGDIELDI